MLKKLLKKSYRNTKKLLKIKKYEGKETTEFDDLETVDYDNDTSVSGFVNLKKNQRNTTGIEKKY